MSLQSLPSRSVAYCLAAAVVLSVSAVLPAAAQTAARPPVAKLHRYNVDPNSITVSGVSSGGYMANQVHVAFSKHVIGAGIVAAGPFRCSETDLLELPLIDAMTHCSAIAGFLGEPNVERAIRKTDKAAEEKRIDPLSNLCRSKVFLFSSEGDTVVPTAVTKTLETFYRKYLVDQCERPGDADDPIAFKLDKNSEVPHAFVTEGEGVACPVMNAEKRKTFVCDGHFDTARAILEQVYGTLQDKVPPVAANLIEFDQSEFIDKRPGQQLPHDSLHSRAHIYVPKSCTIEQASPQAQPCRLHIAFHGCLQSQDAVGDAFYGHAGYNGWAESNRIIVLYPQVKPTGEPMNSLNIPNKLLLQSFENPQGCWDFWAYSSSEYYAGYDDQFDSFNLAGRQLTAIREMINRIVGDNTIPNKLP
jgi:hypothetical protein